MRYGIVLPCNNEDVPGLLHGFGDYVARLQTQSREAAVQVAQLQAQVCGLEQEVTALQQRLRQAEGREQSQAERTTYLAEQLAAAKDAAAAAARACEEERQAGAARSKQADESQRHFEQLLAQAQQRSETLAEELQQGRARECQQQQQRLYNHRAAEVERQQLQSELAAVQHERQQLEKQLATCSKATPPAELTQLEQEVAELRQQLKKEQQEKKHALERRAKYKHLFTQAAEAYRQMKNAYSRLKRERGVRHSASAAPPCPGQQLAVSGRLTPDTADGEHWQDSADSDREPLDHDLSGSGRSSKRRRASPGSDKEPAEQQQSRLASGGSRQLRGSSGSAQQALEQPEQPSPSQQAGSTHLLPSQQALKPAASRDAGTAVTSSSELPAQAVPLPPTSTGDEPRCSPSASACQPAPGAATTVKLDGSPPTKLDPDGSCENSQESQPAGCPVRDIAASAAEPLRPMNPPPPRRCPPVPAVAHFEHARPPTAQQLPEAGPPEPAVVPVQALAEPPCCVAACDETQPDTFQPLHQLARTPKYKQPLKRPSSEAVPESISHPAAPPDRQGALDATTAPSWGPACGRQTAAVAAEAGPAWKKVARADNYDQRAFNEVDGLPPPDSTPQTLAQQQQDWQLDSAAAALAPGAQLSRRGSSGAPLDSSKGGLPGAPKGDAGPGYKFQDVVRKRDERQKLKGMECLQCQRFYEALQTWGTVAGGEPLPGCGHVSRGAVPAAMAGPLVTRDELREAGSRHRYRYQPPATPDEFWNMGFGTTD